jgi:hypothetical protein
MTFAEVEAEIESIPKVRSLRRVHALATEAGNETVCRIGETLAIRFGCDPAVKWHLAPIRPETQFAACHWIR